MSVSKFEKYQTALNQYAKLVNFVRLQEALGKIRPDDAFDLLNKDATYQKVLEWNLRSIDETIDSALLLSPHQLNAGVASLRKRILKAFPGEVERIESLEKGLGR